MTEKDKKRVLIIGGITVAVILLFLLMRNRSIIERINGVDNVALGDVIIPSINIPERGAMIIPGLPTGNYNSYSAIGACCVDCGSSGAKTRTDYSPAGTTIVFNEGNKGPNIYNYVTPVPKSSGTFYGVRR